MTPLTIACAQPQTVLGDLPANVAAHVALIEAAAAHDAQLVIFPELSLTGYDLDAKVVAINDPALEPLVEACGRAQLTALAGAPIHDPDQGESIAAVAVDGEGCVVAYRKMFPGAKEQARFQAGNGPAAREVFGWRVGLAICRDIGVAEHAGATAELGVDLYAAGLVDLPDDVDEQRRRAERIRRRLGVPVAISSAAGRQASGFARTAGRSFILGRDGKLVAQANEHVGELAVATVQPNRVDTP